ncbi:ParB/RepB/Spo0J family partition protein [Nocardia asteroides]|uniref:ParB/RepB/Spo0J family partition protein n=1 Tax=Nocardia asteroides TaxID=1824 RepID=UPI001E416D2F|nr:ParB/RepB/Spo0J family partition protein [Nocardia asteroides]UGT58912.1 ParB/RepB/Spo0J family partition protein [Nocardia asteroides]
MTPLQVAELPRIPLSQIAPHPLNPEHRHIDAEELQSLAADIKRRGLLTPILVASRDKVVSYDADLDAQISESAQVVLADGHRRWGAAQLAGVLDVPYLLREDLADPSIAAEVFLASNIHHQRLTPIEEAQGYVRLQRYRKVKQSELGELVGVSQSRVSKTLKLLELPTVVQAAVSAGTVSPHAARDLLAVPADAREQTFTSALETLSGEDDLDRPARVADALRAAINTAKKAAEEAEAANKARRALAEQGISEIDPDEMFGPDEWRHQLRDSELDEVRDAGELAGAVVQSTGRVVYYSTPPAPRHRVTEVTEPVEDGSDDADSRDASIPMEYGDKPEVGEGEADNVHIPMEYEATEQPTSSAEESGAYSNGISVATDEPGIDQPAPVEAPIAAIEIALRAGEEAHHGRVEAMRRIVADHTQGTLLDVLADAVLATEWIEFDTGHQLASGLGHDVSPTAVEHLLMQGRRVDIHRTALAAALAALEAEAARSTYAAGGTWPIVIQRHVQRLASLGHYTLTPFDTARLDPTQGADK